MGMHYWFASLFNLQTTSSIVIRSCLEVLACNQSVVHFKYVNFFKNEVFLHLGSVRMSQLGPLR